MVHYAITPLDPHGHQFAVTLQVTPRHAEALTLTLPAWIPGSYMIRDFARNILDLRAEANGQALTVKAIDKQSWQIAASAHPITINYLVYAFDLSVRSAYLDQFWGFFNNSSLCLAVQGYEHHCIDLTLQLPEQLADWHVATGMPRLHGETFGAGRFRAENYDALLDYPFLLGKLGIHEFIAGGRKHALVTAGRCAIDAERICGDLATLCEYQIELFDKQAPFDQYLFLTMVVGQGFGGLEHRNSTALMCSRRDLPHAGVELATSKDYQTFLSLCSHEYFHSWNIKTLKPKEFLPYQLDREQYTRQLWFYEGVTSYFDDYVLHAAGLIDADTYLARIGDTLARVQRGVGGERQTVADSSFHAWTRFYKQDENAPNAIVSYYAKGALIALCLDLLIRSQTRAAQNLGTVMSAFWQRYGKTLEGTTETSFADFLQATYKVNLHAFISRAIDSTEPLPVTELLHDFGVEVTRAAAQDDNSYGGRAAQQPLPVSLGARFKGNANGLELQVVFADEAAQLAGLSAQDRIIAFDHLQITGDNFRELMQRYRHGDTVTVHAFRRDELFVTTLVWQAPKASNFLLKVTDPTRAQGWLQL
ncbi:aminopeptidase [Pseudidiomarina sediminum]|uniref:Aminopeptidase n=1 Tax=Pseudidiomarina sediminum TaxID=431675 RepID=A0A432Z7R6_9GAMM|nr:aminopeptidase [Pseudidiomarina sediminum]